MRRLVVAAVTVLGVVLAAVATAATVHLSGVSGAKAPPDPSQRGAIIAAAVSGVSATATYNWKTLAHDESVAEGQLAEPLRSQYAERMATQVAPLAQRYHAVSRASVDPHFGAGVVSQHAGRATVLLYLDQVVTNSKLPAPRLDQTRVLATVVDQGGKWLVSAIQTL